MQSAVLVCGGRDYDNAEALCKFMDDLAQRIILDAVIDCDAVTSSGMALTFAIAVVIVLVAQFESLTSAVIVLITVPFGWAAAVFALLLTGGSLNVCSQPCWSV